MLRPTPEEVLTSISYTFDTLIRPDPASPLAVSYSLTVSNMLRQLLLTMRHEERAISEDSIELRSVLEETRAFLRRLHRGALIGDRIASALSASYEGPEPAHWARQNWRVLRGLLEDVIKHLQAVRGELGDDAEYRALRQSIRDYLDRSLDREKLLIDGAFTLARR